MSFNQTPGGFACIDQCWARTGTCLPSVPIIGVWISHPLGFLFFALVNSAFGSENVKLVETIASSLLSPKAPVLCHITAVVTCTHLFEGCQVMSSTVARDLVERLDWAGKTHDFLGRFCSRRPCTE
jgi:hypothetical protein